MTERRTNYQYHEYARRIGDKVRQGRALRRVKQRDLAVVIGVTSTQLYKYETGENRLCIVRLCLIAEFLELPLDWFVRDIMPNALGAKGVGRKPLLRLTVDTLTQDIATLTPEQSKQVLLSMLRQLGNLS